MTVGLLLAAALATLLLGFTVLMRQPKSARSFTFFLATFFASVWTIGVALFLSVDSDRVLMAVTSSHYVASATAIYCFLLFAYAYSGVKMRFSLIATSIVPLLVFAGIIIFSPSTILDSVTVGVGTGNTADVNTPFYSIYALFFIAYFVWAMMILWRGRKRANNPDKRNRYGYIMLAFSVAGAIGMLFNLVIPGFGNYSLIWIGPLGLFLFSWVLYVAMARYHLFDVRTVVVRILMYVSIVGALGIVYSLVFYVITTYFLHMGNTSTLFYIINVLLMSGVVVAVGPVTRHIGPVIDRWFLRDNYDADRLIARINSIAVRIHSPHEMAQSAASEIAKTLHVRHVRMVFDARGESDELLMSVPRGKTLAFDDKNTLRSIAAHAKARMTVVDDIDNQPRSIAVFRKYNIAALVAIGGDVESGAPPSGLIILGPKNHHSLFVQKDRQALTQIANILAIAIESARYYQRIQTFNTTLNHKVREATAELRQSNAKLRKLDEVKDDFISMASHQLRTPLTSVRGYLSMILEGDMGKISENQRRILSEAYISSKRMAFLISDFLDVSRLQTGKFELQKSPTRLDEVLQSEISQLEIAASARDIKLSYSPPATLPEMSCDKNKLRQVMMNMIDNAIFYSHAGGSVEIELHQQRGNVYFTVRDHGIGVPRTEQMKLFGKFFRGSNARKVRPDGTGIGLYMARKVVLAHGGSIIFESKENKGSTFGFRIPID